MAICHNLQVADLGFCDRKIPISGVWHQPPRRRHVHRLPGSVRVAPAIIGVEAYERLFERMSVATNLGDLQSKLWEAADELRANSGLKVTEYASPVLGLIFFRYADE